MQSGSHLSNDDDLDLSPCITKELLGMPEETLTGFDWKLLKALSKAAAKYQVPGAWKLRSVILAKGSALPPTNFRLRPSFGKRRLRPILDLFRLQSTTCPAVQRKRVQAWTRLVLHKLQALVLWKPCKPLFRLPGCTLQHMQRKHRNVHAVR